MHARQKGAFLINLFDKKRERVLGLRKTTCAVKVIAMCGDRLAL